MRTSHRTVIEVCRKVLIDDLGVFGGLLERPVRGPKVNTSGVKANMETVEESGENVYGDWGSKAARERTSRN